MPAASVNEKAGLRLILSDPAVRVVILIVFVVMLGFGIIAPILPLYARSFGVSYQTASLLIAVFPFARLIFDPVAGPIIDRYGERRSAIVGVLIVGVSALLAGLAPTFLLAVLFRGAGGGGSAVFLAALYSYLLKVVPSERMARTLSVFYGSLNVGIIAGGPIGGFVAQTFGLASPLILYSGLCLVSAVLYVRFMRDAPGRTVADVGEPPSRGAEAIPLWRRLGRQIAVLLRTPAFATVLMLNVAFFWFVAGAYDTLVPLFAKEELGMSTVGVGVVFTIAVAAEFLVLYPTASVADRTGRKRVVLPSMAALAVLGAALGWAASPIALGVLMALVGLASGAVASTPAAMLSDVAPPEDSGTAVGIFRFAGDLGFVLGPLVGGIVAGQYGFKAGFVVMGIPAVVALVFALRTPETLKTDAAEGRREPVPASPLD
ncbi:MAG: MFS transporter [Actinomycetota bacterium]|nr:MFS transporter [Actinomycetota bacterium]